ncbi:MAG: hypothetical protein IJO43_03355 [Bacilli bacterium]|nr:hypothetical protein [Bacilli bacterium]
MLGDVLPILLYILGSILLVVLIILGIKLIQTVDRANALLDDLEEKSKSLDGIFTVVDNFSNAIAVVGDRVVDGIAGMVSSFFHKRKKKKIKEEEKVEYEEE